MPLFSKNPKTENAVHVDLKTDAVQKRKYYKIKI